MEPIKRFVRVEDVPLKMNADISGNPRDQGCWKCLIARETGSQDLSLGMGWMKPGEVHPLHHHVKASEFYYVLEGSATMTVAGEEFKATPGTAVYIPAGDTHRIVNDGEGELVVLFGYNRPEWENIWDE